MKATGRLVAAGRDLSTGKCSLLLMVDGDAADALTLREQELDITLTKHHEKRSLNANAFYWALITKYAEASGVSAPEAHNTELQRYGTPETVNGELVRVKLPDDDKTYFEVSKKVEFHLSPTPEVIFEDGKIYRVYILMRGSSTYDTKEMARLIDGLIADCRDIGIPDGEIATPFEKQKLKEQYGVIL